MKTQEKSAPVNKVNKVQTVKATNNVDKLAKQVQISEPKKISQYDVQVLQTNRQFKLTIRNVGGAIKVLLASDVLKPEQITFLKAIQKSDELYKKFEPTVRKTKNNQVTPFYVLQAMFKAMKK